MRDKTINVALLAPSETAIRSHVLNVITWLDSLCVCVCSLIYVIMLINVVIRSVSLWRNRRGQQGAFVMSEGPVQNQIITVI